MLAVAYLRVSTDDQSLGLDVQRKAIDSFAQAQGYQIASYHVDKGISGATPILERKAFQQALQAAQSGKASAIIVHKRDRLARDVLIATMAERSLPKGTILLSADGTANGNSPADALMRTILDGMSQYERALIRARTSSALRSLQAKGIHVGKPPYGFRVDANGHLAPIPKEQATIQRIQDLHAFGFPQRAIVRILLSEGFLTRNGKPFHLTQVRRILHLDSKRAA